MKLQTCRWAAPRWRLALCGDARACAVRLIAHYLDGLLKLTIFLLTLGVVLTGPQWPARQELEPDGLRRPKHTYIRRSRQKCGVEVECRFDAAAKTWYRAQASPKSADTRTSTVSRTSRPLAVVVAPKFDNSDGVSAIRHQAATAKSESLHVSACPEEFFPSNSFKACGLAANLFGVARITECNAV